MKGGFFVLFTLEEQVGKHISNQNFFLDRAGKSSVFISLLLSLVFSIGGKRRRFCNLGTTERGLSLTLSNFKEISNCGSKT